MAQKRTINAGQLNFHVSYYIFIYIYNYMMMIYHHAKSHHICYDEYK